MAGNLHIGEINFDFLFAFKDDAGVAIDLTGVPVTNVIRFQRPKGTTEDVDMVIDAPATDGKARVAVTLASFLNETGLWCVRGDANGRLSDPSTFTVDPDLPAP